MRIRWVLNGFNPRWAYHLGVLRGFCRRCAGDAGAEGFCICPPGFDFRALSGAEGLTVFRTAAYSPETVLAALVPLMNDRDMYVFSGDYAGAELAVRGAARKGGSSLTGVRDMAIQDGVPVAHKRIYSSHVDGVFRMLKPPFCITPAAQGDVEPLLPADRPPPEPAVIDLPEPPGVLRRMLTPEPPPAGLAGAKLLCAAGYGAGSKEGVAEIAETAEALGGEYGVSRPAAMHGWAPMDRLLGVSGATVQPEVCIAVGVSGSAAFFAGIEKSGFIAAINADKTAPIMQMADVALVGDGRTACALLRKLHEKGTTHER